jgi:transcriptional regulator with XRE-family HTH domain
MLDAKTSPGGFGGKLRAYRQQAGLTLAELHERTGLALSTLSKAENSKISLTYDKIEKICVALGIDMAQIVATTAPVSPQLLTGRRSISRAGDSTDIESPHYVDKYLITEILNKGMTPVIVEPKTKSIEKFDDFHRHPGEEYVYVLEGEVDFHTEIYAPVRLSTGDSIYFDSDIGHAWIDAGESPCRLLSICLRSDRATDVKPQGIPVVTAFKGRRRSAS